MAIDMTKIDWKPRTRQVIHVEDEDDEDIHGRQLKGNINFIDMKLPRDIRYAYIKLELQPRLK